MKMLFVLFALAMAACTSSPSPSPAPAPVPGASPTPSPSVACSLEQSVAGGMANGVASALGCTNEAAIESDILAAAGKVNFCAEVEKPGKPKGAIGNIMCPIVVQNISAIALSKVSPSWGCSGSVTTQQLSDKFTSLCKQYISL